MDLAIDVRLAAKSTTLNLDSMSFVFIASKVGKGQAEGQPLPVVAVGLIPHIYRRASFTHRATP